MAIQNFSKLLENQVYKQWLKNLDKNIITSTAKQLRSSQEVASKTSFYITEETVQKMFTTITGKDISKEIVKVILEDLRGRFSPESGTLQGTYKIVAGQKAVFFENIGFKTISSRLAEVFSSQPAIEDAFIAAENKFRDEQIAAFKSSKEYSNLSIQQKNEGIREIEKEAARRATLGFYFNKGHVIAVATNLAKQFKEKIAKADALAKEQQDALISVLDLYINRLEKDDLASANLPNALSQEMYASYIKSSEKYLVEIQVSVENIGTGRASIGIVEELRDLFGGKLAQQELLNTITNNSLLGQALITDKGSPSMLELIEQQIVGSIKTGKASKAVYRTPRVKIGETSIKLNKPKKKTKEIAAAKAIRNQLKNTRANPNLVVNKPPKLDEELSITSLQTILNANLIEQVKQNMGTGNSTTILNLRSGRFAESVRAEKISQSRQGMITVFYSYMKNPYATFSRGGRKEYPRSRDPKLLISKSIRQLLQERVANKLRSVSV